MARCPDRVKLLGISSLVAALAICAGCDAPEEIQHYTVNKPLPLEPRATADPHAGLADTPPTGEPTDRTLGAIVPLTEQGWFFKLTGPKDAVASQEKAFSDFVKAVRFSAEGKPQWKLPEGWRERPGNQIRYATLVIPGEPKPLVLSVTVLPKSGDETDYILANVNRWRGQMRLQPITAEQLPAESTRLEMDGAAATVVNLVGHAAPGGMGGPFSSGARDGN
jgi:hypothetical protein